MTEAQATLTKPTVEIGSDLSHTITLDGAKLVVSPEGEVAVYTDLGIQTKPAAAANEQPDAVSAYGVKTALAADGSLVIYTNNTPTIKPLAVYDTAVAAARAALVVGAVMKDDTIYAGESPTTHQPMYATREDAPLRMTFNEAAEYASTLEAGGKKDFRMPDQAELNVLYKNRNEGALAGTFNDTGSITAGWFWSSTLEGNHRAWSQRFSNGSKVRENKRSHSSVRCIR